jgi:hypothetical protein
MTLQQDLMKLAHRNPEGIRRHLVPILRTAAGWEDEAVFQTGEELRVDYSGLKAKKHPTFRDAIVVTGKGLHGEVWVFRDERAARQAAIAETVAGMDQDPSEYQALYIEPFLSVSAQRAKDVAYDKAFEYVEYSATSMSDRDLAKQVHWSEEEVEADRDGAEDLLLEQLTDQWGDEIRDDPVGWYEEHQGELFLSEIPTWMDFDIQGAAEEYVDSNGIGETFEAGTDEVELDGGAVLIPFD